jgi:uncharacterized protein (DUF2249 family)
MKTTTLEPVLASWKVSEVLKRYPELLEVLVSLNPTFRMLRNHLTGKVQSRLVTVAQAAEIVGMEPADLVRSLNQAIGIAAPVDVDEEFAADGVTSSPPPWVDTTPVAAEVDARPFQKSGQEPFSVVMAAVREVGVGNVLQLRNTFEPVPIYDVLGMRGFVHFARQHGPEDWKFLFLNIGSGQVKPAESVPARGLEDAAFDWDAPSATLRIDVSELVPPEPLIRIMGALEQLPEGATVLAHHVRRPLHLNPRLDALGYQHETRDLGPGQVEILIKKSLEAGR